MNPLSLEPMQGCPFAHGWERQHGPHCSCRLLAAAAGADAAALDYGFCSRVLQRRWRMMCDHTPAEPERRAILQLPPHDARDPIHALLIAGADTSCRAT